MGRNDPRNNLKKKEKKKSAHDNGGQLFHVITWPYLETTAYPKL